MLVSFLKNLKQRLQFTGWLQYMLMVVLAVLFFLMAAIAWLLGWDQTASGFGLVGSFLLIVSLFDVITVKFNFRPQEKLPLRNDHLDPFDLMRARRSCRSFQARNLTQEHYHELMKYVGQNTNTPNLSKVGEGAIRFEYVKAPLTVWPVVGANEFLVAIAPSEYNRKAIIDVGSSLQKIVIDATSMGLATCWIGPGADQESIVSHLGERFNSTKDHVVCVCAVGYKSNFKPLSVRLMSAIQNKRLPLSSLFFTDSQFDTPLNLNEEPFKKFGRTYEVCQWSPSSFNGQTTRCVGVVEEQVKAEKLGEKALPSLRFDFYTATESRFYAPLALGIWCANWEMGCEALGIHGQFEVLSDEKRGIDHAKNIPHYDVSWLPN